MNRFLIAVVLIVACTLGLGYYLGWFSFESESNGGKSHIQLTVDQTKIQHDEKTVVDKVHNAVHQENKDKN
jgi:hypothetical protein